MSCDHTREGTVEPVQGWHGRYRCRVCGVFFYTAKITSKGIAPTSYFKHYKCYRKGCEKGAVTHEERNYGANKRWACQEHRSR